MKYLIVTLSLFGLVLAQNCTTVDDSDSSISYSGTWEPVSRHASLLDFGGVHHISSDVNAQATFTFTGKARMFAMGVMIHN